MSEDTKMALAVFGIPVLIALGAGFASAIVDGSIVAVCILGPIIGLAVGYVLGWSRVRLTAGLPLDEEGAGG